MSETSNTLLSSWLKLLCGMIPGISQAIVLVDSDVSLGIGFEKDPDENSNSVISWPKKGSIHTDLMSAAKLAESQNKNVTTTLSSSREGDSISDMVIAMPLNVDLSATLAILVRIKPSQQSIVMQILQWGEDWLALLLQKEKISAVKGKQPEVKKDKAEQNKAPVIESLSAQARQLSFFKANRSRIIAGGILFFAILMSVLTGTYRVTAPASLEGKIQRAIVAPFDGYIANAFVRAGEKVKSGDLIAEMDKQSLMLEQQRYLSEKNEHTRQYRQTLAVRDKAQAHIFKSKIEQADAQLELLDIKIQRSTLNSPIDGVIISGDLSRLLGAPVTTGDVLFEISPLDEYRLIISVDEDQVVDVQQGLQGVLSLTALPDEKIKFTVQNVSPVFEENIDGISYRVEAAFGEKYPALRPGMQGVAKIEIDKRSFIWIYLHQLYDAIRLWVWSWLP